MGTCEVGLDGLQEMSVNSGPMGYSATSEELLLRISSKSCTTIGS